MKSGTNKHRIKHFIKRHIKHVCVVAAVHISWTAAAAAVNIGLVLLLLEPRSQVVTRRRLSVPSCWPDPLM